MLITKSEKKDLKIGFLKKNCEIMKSEVIKSIILLISLSGIVFPMEPTSQAGGSTNTEAISSALCYVVDLIKSVAVVLAIAMFVIGGLLYAVGNLLTGQMKQSAHGWAQGLIIGAIIAVVLIAIAQPLVNIIAHVADLPEVTSC